MDVAKAIGGISEQMQTRFAGREGQVLETCPKCGDATAIVKTVSAASIVEARGRELEREIDGIRRSREYGEHPNQYEKKIDVMRMFFDEWKDGYEGGFEPFPAPCRRPCACGLCR